MLQKEELILEARGLDVSKIRQGLLDALLNNKPIFGIFVTGYEFHAEVTLDLLVRTLEKNGWSVKEIITLPKYIKNYGTPPSGVYHPGGVKVVVVDMRLSLNE